MYKATLIKGVDYQVMGYFFKINQSKEVSKEAYEYLEGIPVFEVESQGVEQDPPSNPEEKHARSSIKKLSADEQRALIEELGGNPDETSNEEERIALILELQGE